MRKRVIVLLTLVAITCLPLLFSGTAASQTSNTANCDISCDGHKFALNQLNHSATAIQRGDTFVLSGSIYPAGTIPAGGTRTSPSTFGPDHEGSIGTWICRGVFLAAGPELKNEKIQRATTQYFLFNDKNRIFTEGFEGPVMTTRAVLGGVRDFAGVRGVATMERIGINATGSYNLRIVFTLQ